MITAGMLLESKADCSEALAEGIPAGASSVNVFYDPDGSRMALAARIAPGRNRVYLIHHKDVLSLRLSGLRSAEEMIGTFRLWAPTPLVRTGETG